MTKKTLTGLAIAGLSAAVLATALPMAAMAKEGPGGPMMGLMLHRFDEIDADKDGKLTEAELTAFRATRFAAADADGSGGLSAEELAAFRAAQMAERQSEMAGRMLERLDADNDGQLSAAEFAAMAGKRNPFDRADTDGDGAVSRAEAEAMVQKMTARGGKHNGRGHGGWWGQDAD